MKNRNKYKFNLIFGILIIFYFLSQNAVAQSKTNVPALIPIPQKIVWNGEVFITPGNEKHIATHIVKSLPGVSGNQEEAYILKINSDSIVLLATTEKGLFYGKQTINQLTYNENGKLFVAGCEITDWPAFKIRGFMQDVGRNFQSMEMLKEQIDFPELVKYCGDRHINLIPEFDIPGHSEAFRKAFALDSMSDSSVKTILIDLIDELCSLVPKEKMPFIHLGTDEVWSENEKPADGLLDALVERVKYHKREVIVWRPGQQIESDKSSITQLWSSAGRPKAGHHYIDSRLNYLNHLDPLAGIVQLYFDRICGAAHGDSLRMSGILCCWNDNLVSDEYDIIRQNPVYPGMLTYSETSWKGQPVDFGENYLAKLPAPDNLLFKQFQDFEVRLVRHRDLYFLGKPFPYVKQTQMVWNIFGPFENNGDKQNNISEALFFENTNSEDILKKSRFVTVHGRTVHNRHFFGFPSYFSEKQGIVFAVTNIWSPKDQEVGCWICFHDWSRSDGRRGGPFPQQGQWHNTDAKVWVNENLINPPVWKNPGLDVKSEEIHFCRRKLFFPRAFHYFIKKRLESNPTEGSAESYFLEMNVHVCAS
ncbi:MAG TPA: family 20 glycosylhydrolase [Draconibacterium sp.]|nr:family 20 glycosylhydrolase [Draconibacterium sp.]